jgi:hypothetical protein
VVHRIHLLHILGVPHHLRRVHDWMMPSIRLLHMFERQVRRTKSQFRWNMFRKRAVMSADSTVARLVRRFTMSAVLRPASGSCLNGPALKDCGPEDQ